MKKIKIVKVGSIKMEKILKYWWIPSLTSVAYMTGIIIGLLCWGRALWIDLGFYVVLFLLIWMAVVAFSSIIALNLKILLWTVACGAIVVTTVLILCYTLFPIYY